MYGGMGLWNRIRVFMVVSACLMLAALLAGSYLQTDHEGAVMDEVFLEYAMGGQKMAFRLWEDGGEGVYYLFLPSCLAGEGRKFVLHYPDGRGILKIDGKVCRDGEFFYEEGDECVHRLELEGPFGVTYMDKGLKALVSENLPAVMIAVEDEKDLLDLKEFGDKKYIETGSMVMLDAAGNVVCKEELEKFKVRGNLTATLDKKPFTFSFSEPVGLCGMAPAVKWNLLANATDGSYIRNKLALDLANESILAYEPDGEFVEVYLNGGYQGLYLLTEAVEIAENRVDISPADSWFLEMELDFRLEEDMPYVVTDRGQIFAIHSDGRVSEEEKQEIRQKMNDIESALFAEDGVSRLSGRALGELIDLGSWAEAWLIQEISGDHDTGIASQFAYVPDIREGSLLYAGPVWDFDGTMGNVNTAMFRNPAALTTSIEQTRPEGNANQNRWLSAMYRNAEFREVVREKYVKIFRGNLEKALEVKIEGYLHEIRKAAALDAFRWHEKRLDWMFTLPEGLDIPEGDDYRKYAALESHAAMVKDFLCRKKEFLDKLWVEQADYCIVEVRNDFPTLNQDYNQTVYYWVERGTPIRGLPRYETEEGGIYGYMDSKTGERVSDGMTVWEDLVLVGVQDG